MKRLAVTVPILICLAALSVPAQMQKVPVRVSGPGKEAEPKSVKVKAEPAKTDKRVIRFISDFNSPPFSFKEGMKKAGLEVGLVEALARLLGKRVEWVEKNFSIPAYASELDMGGADAAIASITVTEERKRQLDFTDPYFVTSLAVAVKDDVDWEHNDFENGLKNWVVGVVRGTTGEIWARKNITGEINTYASTERLMQKLNDAKIGSRFCVISDEPLLVGAADNTGYKFKIVEKAFSRQRYAIAVKKGNTELRDELNKAINAIHANGEYDKIFHKWYEEASELPLAGKYE